MEISEFTLRILLLFFPGLICSLLVNRLTDHGAIEPFFFTVHSFVLGLSSYLTYWGILQVLAPILGLTGLAVSRDVAFFRALGDAKQAVAFGEIAWVSLTALGLAILLVVNSTYKLGFRLAQRFRISRKFGEQDVWSHALNMREGEWVTVRDAKSDLAYDGWIKAFSGSSKEPELFLRDAGVYRNSSGLLLYQVGALYLGFKEAANVSIEFRSVPVSPEYLREPRQEQDHGQQHE